MVLFLLTFYLSANEELLKSNKILKVLQYNDTYKHLGGAETYCLELLDKLNALGHDTYWLAHSDDQAKDDKHIVLPHSNIGRVKYFSSKYFFNPTAYRQIREALEQVAPDVVHLHHNRFYTYSVFKALADTGIPTVATIHDYTLLCPSQYYPDLYYDSPSGKRRSVDCQLICSQGKCLPWTHRIGHRFAQDRKRGKFISRISTFIAPSTKLKEYLERAGFENVRHLPFFVDAQKWSFDAHRNMKNVVLFVGRVEENKGIYMLIDAIRKLIPEIPDLLLLIAGGGTQVERISQLVRAESLDDHIKVLGFIDYSRIEDLYNRANLLVVPSLDMEQFGLIGIEGLASGIAVIGSATGGIPEWCIHQQTGLLFDPDQPDELVDSIRKMLSDDSLRKQLTNSGIKHIQNVYNEQQHFDTLLDIYASAKKIKG